MVAAALRTKCVQSSIQPYRRFSSDRPWSKYRNRPSSSTSQLRRRRMSLRGSTARADGRTDKQMKQYEEGKTENEGENVMSILQHHKYYHCCGMALFFSGPLVRRFCFFYSLHNVYESVCKRTKQTSGKCSFSPNSIKAVGRETHNVGQCSGDRRFNHIEAVKRIYTWIQRLGSATLIQKRLSTECRNSGLSESLVE